MSTSQRSFDQVKSILGKLDRDIDAARSRRLGDGPSPVRSSPQGLTPGDAYIGRASSPSAAAAAPARAAVPASSGASSSNGGTINPTTGRMVATRVQRRPDQR